MDDRIMGKIIAEGADKELLDTDDTEWTDDDVAEKNPGKEKCEKLRAIRVKIAEANGIEYTPEECYHVGPCRGTCPACDREIAYLDGEIQKKIRRGEEITLTGLAADEILSSQRSVPEDEPEPAYVFPDKEGGLLPEEYYDDEEDDEV